MIATSQGTKILAAGTTFLRYSTVFLMAYRNSAANTPPITGEITQLATILAMTAQSAMPQPPAAIPAPRTPPTMEWVVDTGAPIQVARFSHRAPARSAAVISHTKALTSSSLSAAIMPPLMVETTSPPAMMAPPASNTAAIRTAPPSDSAPDPTAGPTLLATSFAPILIAM